MADDDDIDKFLEEIENDESLNLTVVENPGANVAPTDGVDDDGDNAFEEADEFLRELENTEELRKEMFSSPGMSSTPKLMEKIKSRMNRMSESALKATAKTSDKNEAVNKSDAESENKKAKLDFSDGKNEIVRDVSNILGDKSTIVSGNLYNDFDIDDAYLLDEEDDDDQGYADELTIQQLLDLEGLLDSSDEEEDNDILEITVIEKKDKEDALKTEDEKKSNEGKKVASVQPNEQSGIAPKPPMAQKPKKPEKFNMAVVKNIKYEYYNELKILYDRYLNCLPPDFNLIREPRIFRDRSKNIIGYESIDEYLDNNHPLWAEDRKMFAYFIHNQCDNADVAEHVRRKWNTGLHVDLCQNLTCIPRTKYVERDKNSVYIAPVHEEKSFDKTFVYKDMPSLLQVMQNKAKTNESMAQEDERYEEFQSTKNKDKQEHRKAEGCDYCTDFCLCGSQKNAKLMEEQNRVDGGRKRKRTTSSGFGEGEDNVGSHKKHKKLLRRDEIINIIYNQNRHLRVDEIAKLVKSAEDVMEFNWCYTKGETMSKQMIQELASLEVVYKGFEYYYSSPYKQANNNKGKSNDASKNKNQTPNPKPPTPGQKDKPDNNTGARPGSSASTGRPGSRGSMGRPASRTSTGRPGSGAGSARSESPMEKKGPGYQGLIEDY